MDFCRYRILLHFWIRLIFRNNASRSSILVNVRLFKTLICLALLLEIRSILFVLDLLFFLNKGSNSIIFFLALAGSSNPILTPFLTLGGKHNPNLTYTLPKISIGNKNPTPLYKKIYIRGGKGGVSAPQAKQGKGCHLPSRKYVHLDRWTIISTFVSVIASLASNC